MLPTKRLVACLILAAPSLSHNLVAGIQDDARRALATEPFMPAAGESPDDYWQRVNEYKRRQKMINDLANVRVELANLNAQARRLTLQIQNGMVIPEDQSAKPTAMTEEQKGAMLRELLKLQEKMAQTQVRARALADAIERDNEQISEENTREEIRHAVDRQTMDILKEIRDGNLRNYP